MKIIKNKTPVESTILSNLPDYLNIEIAFNRIYTFLDALNWFSQTFLWIRIKRLLSKKLKQKNNSYMKKVIFIIKSFFISQSLNELSSSGLINIRRRNFISTTIYGNVCAFYHIDCQTFLEIISKISPITWKDETKFGPPLPTKRRTLSPTSAVIALSPVVEPTFPLNTT